MEVQKQNKYTNRMGKRYKSFQFDTKELNLNSESRTITGYGAVFGNKDRADDILIKGCFAKSIQDRGPESMANDKIIFLYMHDMREPIGRITAMKEDDRGLYFEAIIDDVDRGNQTLKQLESGTLNQFSIGFRYVWEKCEWDEAGDAFIVKEVVLYEISVVSIGANPETEYLGMKTIEDYESKHKELNDEIESFCKGLNPRRQQEIQMILAKSMALASIKPESVKENVSPLEEEQAAACEPKSMINNFKLKEQ